MGSRTRESSNKRERYKTRIVDLVVGLGVEREGERDERERDMGFLVYM